MEYKELEKLKLRKGERIKVNHEIPALNKKKGNRRKLFRI
jgi:hypothetical protein